MILDEIYNQIKQRKIENIKPEFIYVGHKEYRDIKEELFNFSMQYGAAKRINDDPKVELFGLELIEVYKESHIKVV